MQNNKKTFKILLLNMGYSSGINGRWIQYIVKFHKLLLPRRGQKNNIFNQLENIIKRENPNLSCLIEIESKKQIKKLASHQKSFYDISVKYGLNSLLRKIPLLKDNSNGFISQKNYPFKKHYLKNGTKKLLYEIHISSDLTIFFMHFSLSSAVRAKQFKEFSEKFKNVDNKILCGDFNIFGGTDELTYLISESNLIISKSSATFPSYKPNKTLDIFLHSPEITTHVRVLNKENLSDHLPVILEIAL